MKDKSIVRNKEQEIKELELSLELDRVYIKDITEEYKEKLDRLRELKASEM
jgi:hypothetical protein